MRKLKLIAIDGDGDFISQVKQKFVEDESIEFIASAQNGLRGVEIIESYSPDIVLLDVVLPELDGFGVMTSVNYSKLNNKPKFVFASKLIGDSFISKAMQLGATYYLAKPINVNTLDVRIKEFCGVSEKKCDLVDEKLLDQAICRATRNVEEKIANIFISLGIPAHIKGYQFLRESIIESIKNPELINSITKKLYPQVAMKFNTSASKVERAIRHAIEVSWNRGKMDNINKIFGMRVFSMHDKPTNGEFIALLADKLIMEGVKLM